MSIQIEADSGTSQPRMTEIATGLSHDLRSLPGIRNVGAHIGRAVTGDQTVDVDWAHLGQRDRRRRPR